jgi:hypothetical protein
VSRSGPFGQGMVATIVKDMYVRGISGTQGTVCAFADSETYSSSFGVVSELRCPIGIQYTCLWKPLCHASRSSFLAHRRGSTNIPRNVTHLYLHGRFSIRVLCCPVPPTHHVPNAMFIPTFIGVKDL